MASDDGHVEVVNNEAERRYEARVGDEVAAAYYQLEGDRIVFTHTEVPEAARGLGVASALAEAALTDAGRRGLTVVPRCPFFVSYLRRHQDYLPLVAPEERERLRRRPGGSA